MAYTSVQDSINIRSINSVIVYSYSIHSSGAGRPVAMDQTAAASSPVKVVVFDFDGTLAADHVTAWVDRASMADRGFGGAARVAMLDDMLGSLVEAGAVLAVCSLNITDVIRSALMTVNLLHHFGPAPIICDHYDVEDRGGHTKSGVIRDIILPAVAARQQCDAHPPARIL